MPLPCAAAPHQQQKRINMNGINDIFGNGVKLAGKVLDHLWQREEITSDNIANVDTPGYKSKYLTFEEELAKEIRAADASDDAKRHIAGAIDSSAADVHTTANESSRLDGNNVDMDQEQVDLAKTALEYQYMVNSVHSELKRLDAAAKTF